MTLSTSNSSPDPVSQESGIDFVILWVDGDAPEHRAKRQAFLSSDIGCKPGDEEQSIDNLRFIQTSELRYCLRSIKHHAPWYRKIWLVTDSQIPSFLESKKLYKDRIEIVDHKAIFSGNEKYLPTFNTRSIVSLIDKIPGLSQKFIYGNDDFMLGGNVAPDFFFKQGLPVVYGDWVSHTAEIKPTLFQQGMMNAAKMLGFPSHSFINISHGFQPMDRQIIETLRDKFPAQFTNNLAHKFRHRSQFLLESLHNHYCYRHKNVETSGTEPMVHFSFQLCREGEAEKIKFLFDLFRQNKRKMFCINEYQSLYPRLPFVKSDLEALCGPPLVSELAL
ncbi:Stealth CR1 domain-containing protein [Alteromonas stellipolaris]|uniref:Stealth CR1 domain-containing protein n=1 Tax=Alteromonas stellipolaris TaxID=233316 RepID=UPI00273446C2|nr:Stealth CR1 domain-containing protein [Alteromonas stellipolaris]MDP2537421.1 Stealth CR1 domain-containing protein [Alteromonas stellipolaris]